MGILKSSDSMIKREKIEDSNDLCDRYYMNTKL